MLPKLYETIEQAISKGIPPQYLADQLIKAGWPRKLVNDTITAWLNSHGRLHNKTNFREWLKKYRKKAFKATCIVSFVGVLSSSIILLRPWPTKIMIDSVFGNIKAPGPLAQYTHTPTLILITSLMTIVIFVVGAIVGVARDYIVLKLGFWLNRGIKEESFRHILYLPLYHQERLAKGDYIYRQNILTNSLSDLVLDTTSSIIQSVILIVGILAIMLWFNVKLTIISVVLVPFLFLLIRILGPVLGKIARELTQTASATSSHITESVDNAETVQSFTLEEKQIGKANELWWRTYNLTRRSLLWGALFRSTDSLLIILGSSAVMYFGGTAALHQQMTVGQLLIFMTYMGYLLGPIENIAMQIAARNQKLVDVSRVYEVLTDHEGIETVRKDAHLPPLKGRVDFQNVSYAYGDSWVLKNVGLTVMPGEKVGIIGPSGGGKSTLLKLLPLFIDPTKGRIMLDNYDIQTVSLKDLRRQIAWISQTPQLFNGTIAENLIDGDVFRQMTSVEIDKAADVANVKEFTDRMPMGLNSPTGEGGNALSGGQKQRIAIARGLLKNAPIVCMDEPTAALDAKSENFIRDSIERLIKGKTVFMVTHRRALLSLMDVIYVMQDGELRPVEEFGGLEVYLEKIKDAETDPGAIGAGKSNGKQNDDMQKQSERLEALEAENAQLAQKLEESAQNQNTDSGGTIVIGH